MNIIRKMVAEKGSKTDGLAYLLFKAYLIREHMGGSSINEYAPLYVWTNHKGMNRFIFGGSFDYELNSFGWQKINIGVPIAVEFHPNFKKAIKVLEIEHNILERHKMYYPKFSLSGTKAVGRLLLYNPDRWKYFEYYFFEDGQKSMFPRGRIYEILHLSM